MNILGPGRLPHIGTTIFTTMSALATEHGAVNLGQGFPDFGSDQRLLDAVAGAMSEGHNQYAPMTGVPALREAVSAKVQSMYGHAYDPATEITITAGATQAILTAVLAMVQPGDEVVVLEPCYDSYEPAIVMAGATAVAVPLTPGTFRPDFALIAAALTPRTRVIMINTPHNPTATVWTADEMNQLAELLRPTNVMVISDEVYEHMVYDGARHESVSRHPGLAERSLVISSFGKTYHVTGWKIGYAVAPADLMAEFRKVHQFNVFCVNTPMQVGLARYLNGFDPNLGVGFQAGSSSGAFPNAGPQPHLQLPAFYQRKRDMFRDGLAKTRFKVLTTAGTYFQCVDYSAISDQSEEAFCRWLTTEIGVAAIPISAFYRHGFEQRIARFCFAKKDETVSLALERLAKI
ncbi:pyridoxal phosphate-dependent aminotransferase [soil metagenome]